MDRLIWDLDSLHTMLARLRRAAQQIQECQARLYTAGAAAQEMFQSNAGPARQLVEELELLERRTRNAGARSADLADVLARIGDDMARTEQELVRMVSELPTGAEAPQAAARPVAAAVSAAPLYTVPPTRWAYGIVPEWLAQAADRMPTQ